MDKIVILGMTNKRLRAARLLGLMLLCRYYLAVQRVCEDWLPSRWCNPFQGLSTSSLETLSASAEWVHARQVVPGLCFRLHLPLLHPAVEGGFGQPATACTHCALAGMRVVRHFTVHILLIFNQQI